MFTRHQIEEAQGSIQRCYFSQYLDAGTGVRCIKLIKKEAEISPKAFAPGIQVGFSSKWRHANCAVIDFGTEKEIFHGET